MRRLAGVGLAAALVACGAGGDGSDGSGSGTENGVPGLDPGGPGGSGGMGVGGSNGGNVNAGSGGAAPAVGAGGKGGSAVAAGAAPGSGGAGGHAGMPPGTGGSGGAPVAATPGEWKNVTPAGLALGWDGAAGGVVHHVLVDPARPTDVYAFTSDGQGIWRSADYGSTWSRVDTKTPLKGSQRASAIDSNKLRDPSTPPTLWTVNYGDGDNLWKSTDGGVSWLMIALPKVTEFSPYDRDPYSFAVDPYDGKHILMGFHGTRELAESTDAGSTWTVVTTPPGFGTSVYPFFIDTGAGASTRKTWLTQAQWVNWTEGMWRTTDGGVSWKQVSTLEHVHGNGQIFDAGGGIVYAAGVGGQEGHGIYRSADYGATWKRVNDGTIQNAVYGTPNFLYADYGWATGGGQSQKLQRAPRNPGTSWTSYVPTPNGMSNGSNHACVTFDGVHHIVVTGNWTAGIWRYVEP